MKEKPKRKPPAPPPRKVIGDEMPHVASSMRSAASIWKLPIVEIKRAKEGGCKAFVGQKVYLDGLTAWLKSNPPEPLKPVGDNDGDLATTDKEELERLKLIRVVNRLDIGIQADKHKLAVTKESFISKDLVQEEWARLWAIVEAEAKGLMDKAVFPVFIARVKAKIK